jgi:hypothetical protein
VKDSERKEFAEAIEGLSQVQAWRVFQYAVQCRREQVLQQLTHERELGEITRLQAEYAVLTKIVTNPGGFLAYVADRVKGEEVLRGL